MRLPIALRGLTLLVALVLIGYAADRLGLGEILSEHWIDREVRGQGYAGELLFVGVCTLAVGVGVPRQIVSFLGGYAFGVMQGTLLGVLATLLGCIASFYFSRLFARSLVAERLSGRVRRLDDFLSETPFTMTLLIRLLPVGNTLATNLAAGVSSVPAHRFFLGSGIGYVPQTLVFALAGSGVALDPTWRIGGGVLLFVVSGALGIFLYRRLRHGHSVDAEFDREIGETTEEGGMSQPSPSR